MIVLIQTNSAYAVNFISGNCNNGQRTMTHSDKWKRDKYIVRPFRM